jgi:hypothetical protein
VLHTSGLLVLVNALDVVMFERWNRQMGVPDWIFMLGKSAVQNTVAQVSPAPCLLTVRSVVEGGRGKRAWEGNSSAATCTADEFLAHYTSHLQAMPARNRDHRLCYAGCVPQFWNGGQCTPTPPPSPSNQQPQQSPPRYNNMEKQLHTGSQSVITKGHK